VSQKKSVVCTSVRLHAIKAWEYLGISTNLLPDFMAQTCQYPEQEFRDIWRFPEIGVLPVIIHVHRIFHEINHPAIKGSSPWIMKKATDLHCWDPGWSAAHPLI